jgi:septal ring factor EnvC (AmiA/AmiB activator)
MARKKIIKNITTDDLAIIINKGFQGQTDYMDKKFEQVDKKFEQVDRRFEQVDKKFEQVDKKFEQVFKVLKVMDDKIDDISSIKHKVDYIENILAIKK